MREFKPNRFGIRKDWFASVIEKRLSHSGEYVYHLPTGGNRQAVVMNYQYLPVDAGISQDYVLVGTNPTLFGYLEHFETTPTMYKKGNSVHKSSGSQFEVRGILYNVKRVDVNHRGYITIELVKDDNCTEPRAEFEQEMNAFLCSSNCDPCEQPEPLNTYTPITPCPDWQCKEE